MGGEPFVVGVEEGDVHAGGGFDADIACAAAALILGEADVVQAWIADCSDDFGGVVGGGIIHDTNFEVGVGLVENAANGTFDDVARL